jgi:hypothetical protein
MRDVAAGGVVVAEAGVSMSSMVGVRAQPLPGKVIVFADWIQRIANTFGGLDANDDRWPAPPSRPLSSATTTVLSTTITL